MATYASIKYDFTPPAATTSSQIGAGAMVLIKSITSDGSDDTISFVDGTSDVVMDSTYRTYIFKFSDIHSESDDILFFWQCNAAGQSGYNEVVTNSAFYANHTEADAAEFAYSGGGDLADGTGRIILASSSNGNDEATSGELWIFNPSSTTFATMFFSRTSGHAGDADAQSDFHVGGYVNVTAAIDEVQFAMSSGEIQAGTIKMYGIV